jgi:hypothetical protein
MTHEGSFHKRSTSEGKIYTSPSHIVMKFGFHIGPIAQMSAFFFVVVVFISIKWFLKYRVLKDHPQQGKENHVC